MTSNVSELFNRSNSVLVFCTNYNFVVQDLETGEMKEIQPIDFFSPSFKYEGDFERKFLSMFSGKFCLLITDVAKSRINALIEFNRVDMDS